MPPIRLVAEGDQCPRPDKWRYGTRAQAKKSLKRHRNGQKLTIYECGDHFHLGTKNKVRVCNCGHRHVWSDECIHCGCKAGQRGYRW